ncbi:NADH-ubiquinone oxidoreductase chain G [Thioalkalivibrio nitratireducens DSM 14787]|uniref:NADH-quinone oxidoreductase n=1 Tax=Thioalkalivibrio nitratireducens (strain DSM 14787 / UNIQEM 213 / ALEN2) TaxID=1255043 RepID=L0E0I6_THIND|nr:NADH-quinone oxidoreductase subunit NuoG [Thioalkalivibrio nitratireducens]AGA34757.1 NADH-ubiquinone oxidoreductase chain G [Thioalkalivibrio nitratireducens DSM 14787]
MSQDLVTFEIDGQTLQAPKGTMLIDVADDANIHVPRFCYHKKLSVAANCRMCLVEVEKAPKPLPACATPVMEGMKVHTRSPLALAAQKGTMEFLLINHPLDCPICDQGGECELQDVAMGYGESVSRYAEAKRVVNDRDIGPLIETEMTRCIHCTRCVRFAEEIAGVRELGATGRGEYVRIGTYVEHTVSHELSGNVIDLCPVGALTAKPSRYRARAWEYREAPSVAAHDGVGSNVFVHTYNGRVMRVVPRENEAVNETWISDRDRFSYAGLSAGDRLTRPRIKVDGEWQDASWEEALAKAADGLRMADPARTGALLSPSLTLEEFYLAQKVLRGLGVGDIDHRLGQLDFRDEAAAPLFPWLGSAIEDLDRADAVLLVGCNPRREAPMLAHRLRKAGLKGARISAVHTHWLDLTYPTDAQLLGDVRSQVLGLAGVAARLAENGKKLPKLLSDVVAAAFTEDEATLEAQRRIATALSEGHQSHVLLGADAIASPAFSTLRALAGWIARQTGARLGYLAPGANAAGAWLAGCVPTRSVGGAATGLSGSDVRNMLAQGRDAFVLAGIDPDCDFADPVPALRALREARLVVALTAFANPVLEEIADVLLPVATAFETSGTLVNAEGRWQSFRAVATAPAEARPGWKVWRVLGNLLDVRGVGYLDSRAVRDEMKAQLPEAAFSTQVDLRLAQVEIPDTASALVRMQVQGLYSCDPLVRRAAPLQVLPEGRRADTVRIHPQSAGSHADGTRVRLRQGRRDAELTLVHDETVPVGVAVTVAGSAALADLDVPGTPVTLARA